MKKIYGESVCLAPSTFNFSTRQGPITGFTFRLPYLTQKKKSFDSTCDFVGLDTAVALDGNGSGSGLVACFVDVRVLSSGSNVINTRVVLLSRNKHSPF
jgi:hypothetical protein